MHVVASLYLGNDFSRVSGSGLDHRGRAEFGWKEHVEVGLISEAERHQWVKKRNFCFEVL
jgi:hypothetical protein